MEVHRQQCQNCGSYEARNIVARECGKPQTIYVRCGQCQEFVACYVLSDYYHHGRGAESYFKSHGGNAAESGRLALDNFKQAEAAALAGYEQVMKELADSGREV